MIKIDKFVKILHQFLIQIKRFKYFSDMVITSLLVDDKKS